MGDIDDTTQTEFESDLNEVLPPETEGERADDACLVLIYGADLGRRHPLLGEVSIGREDSNTIVVDLAGVSRRHARISRRTDGWLVADTDSTNGTYVNGSEILREQLLSNGDLIKLGGAIFKFIAGSNVEAQFYEEIYRLTILDGLTSVPNKRYLSDFLDREIARSSRHRRPLSLAILDIDHFKEVNDTYGHVAGDYVLEEMVRLIQKHVRREQLLARYGGEEFVLVLPETDLDEARAFCEKMRSMVQQTTFQFDGHELGITVSIGVATLGSPASMEGLVQAADEELLRAKRSGRNRVFATGDP